MLTVLALVAVIAVPQMAASLTRSRLDAAFEALRGDLEFARARAVATGLRHRLGADPQTGEVWVEPYRPEEAALAASAPLPAPEPVLRDRLPEGVRLAGWSVSPLGLAQAPEMPTVGTTVEAVPVLFYPEGRSDSAILVLESAEGERRTLLLDGFTGEIREMTADEATR